MARTTKTTTGVKKPSILSRLRNRNKAKVTTNQSTNPITGTTTTTRTTKTHPNGHGSHGHSGGGPLASKRDHHHTNTASTVGAHPQKRKVSMGDKFSGAMMKLKGSATGRSGVKAAGTRRMHGTDGRGQSKVVV